MSMVTVKESYRYVIMTDFLKLEVFPQQSYPQLNYLYQTIMFQLFIGMIDSSNELLVSCGHRVYCLS